MLSLDNIKSTSPATDLIPITPSNTVNTPEPFRALWIGTGGTLVFTSARGLKRTISGVPAGWFEVAGTRVWAEGTVANVYMVP